MAIPTSPSYYSILCKCTTCLLETFVMNNCLFFISFQCCEKMLDPSDSILGIESSRNGSSRDSLVVDDALVDRDCHSAGDYARWSSEEALCCCQQKQQKKVRSTHPTSSSIVVIRKLCRLLSPSPLSFVERPGTWQ